MHISGFININVIHLKNYCDFSNFFFLLQNFFFSLILVHFQFLSINHLFTNNMHNHIVMAGRAQQLDSKRNLFSGILFCVFFFVIVLLFLLHLTILWSHLRVMRHFRSHRIFQWGFDFEWKIQTTSFSWFFFSIFPDYYVYKIQLQIEKKKIKEVEKRIETSMKETKSQTKLFFIVFFPKHIECLSFATKITCIRFTCESIHFQFYQFSTILYICLQCKIYININIFFFTHFLIYFSAIFRSLVSIPVIHCSWAFKGDALSVMCLRHEAMHRHHLRI